MRRLFLAALAFAMVMVSAPAASAHPAIPLDPTLPTDLTYSATDNVEYLGRFPEHAGTAGGTLSPDGEVFFLTDPRGVFAYDVSTPAAPTRLGFLPVFQQTTGVAIYLASRAASYVTGAVIPVDGGSATTN